MIKSSVTGYVSHFSLPQNRMEQVSSAEDAICNVEVVCIESWQ